MLCQFADLGFYMLLLLSLNLMWRRGPALLGLIGIWDHSWAWPPHLPLKLAWDVDPPWWFSGPHSFSPIPSQVLPNSPSGLQKALIFWASSQMNLVFQMSFLVSLFLCPGSSTLSLSYLTIQRMFLKILKSLVILFHGAGPASFRYSVTIECQVAVFLT